MEYHAVFSKPNPIPLKKLGYSCYDLHFHTEYSDGAAKIKDILSKLEELGIGAAITDHNEVKGIKAANSDKIIPGIEVTIKNNADVLFYFYEKKDLYEFHSEISKKKKGGLLHSIIDMEIVELLEVSKKYSCLSSFAHPEKNPPNIKNPIYRKVDAIEVINSGVSRNCNTMALASAKQLGKAITAGK
ncbi:MAG: PHP domain-containing protein [archaeon]